jgi:YD repeat-containing protein
MRTFLFMAALTLSFSSKAQYYYKDLIGNKESSETIKNYLKSKVSRVVLTSYDAANQKDNDFYAEQQFVSASRSLKTVTRSGVTNESVLISYADDNGNIIKTVDSSDIVVSITSYTYDNSGRLISVVSSSVDSSKTSNESEQHLWQWIDNKPAKMLRIKNRVDTTIVNFKMDENGNITEETETHRGLTSLPVYYYYNENKQLTDIVRFNKRANRLLPEYMFEYSPSDQVIQKITVPANSSDYLIWRYQYNAQGLKTKEVIYDKQKKLTGKIEYQYSFGS